MENNNNDSEKIEFNSMVQILKRLDRITYRINECRDLSIIYTGGMMQRCRDMLETLIQYYKEIYPDLTTDEENLWDEIQKARIKVYRQQQTNPVRIFEDLDKIDLKLRKYAKAHGYLTKNILKLNRTITDM